MKSLMVMMLILGVTSINNAEARKTTCSEYAANFTAACANGDVLESGSSGTATFVGTNCNSTTVNVPNCGCEATCEAGTGGLQAAGHVNAVYGSKLTNTKPKPMLRAKTKKQF